MGKSIYKITNLINEKIYIGQSKNPEKRFKQHISGLKDSIISAAIIKYGKENFSFEIIEEDIDNYNEREIYWIQYYNSFNRDFGYNKTLGGEEPPVFEGEDCFFSKYSNQEILLIQKDLINNIKTYSQISKDYNISLEYLSIINRGFTRKNIDFIYPLRLNGNERLSKEIVNIIIKKLLYSTDSIEKISKDFQISSKSIYKINTEKHFNCLNNIKYPIRNKNVRYSNQLLFSIREELKNNCYKMSQIEKMYNISKSTLSRINQGIKFKDFNYDYPIRSSSQRVYKPVETIPGETGSTSSIDTKREIVFPITGVKDSPNQYENIE